MAPKTDTKIENLTFSQKALSLLKNEKVKYAYDFIFVVAMYGSLLAYLVTFFLAKEFNIASVSAYGVAFYFLKEELPRIIMKSFPPRII